MASSLDVNILRLGSHKQDFAIIDQLLPKETADPITARMIDAYGRYFKQFPKHEKLDWPTFIPMFWRWYPNASADDKTTYTQVFSVAMKPTPEGVRDCLVGDLQTRKLSSTLANAAAAYEEGQDIDFPSLVQGAIDRYKLGTGNRESAWNASPIEDLLDLMEVDSGVRWRLDCLRESMKGLRGGHFLIVGARPDTGKTSFLASELTYMAKQLPEDRGIVWFNNEGTSNEIIPRIWQAAIGCTLQELHELRKKGELRQTYIDAVGRIDRIKVCDIHGWTMAQCELVIEQENPGVVAYDMMDNIKGYGGGADRPDLVLERLYQRGRELAVLHDHIGLATSQVSADGDGELFPRQSYLKDSKTGKAGACDAIVMVGASSNVEMAAVRGVSTPKNKLAVSGKPRDPRAEVHFDFHRARFKMIGTATEQQVLDAENG